MKQTALLELSKAILKLHKALLEYQKSKVEETTGKSLNPYEMLGAALKDPAFAWLKPLSQMAVEIDLEIESLKSTSTSIEAANSPEFEEKKIVDFWTNPPAEFHDQLIAAIEHNAEIAFLFSEVRLKTTAL